VLGLQASKGALEPGLDADLVLLDDDLAVTATMVGGAWIDG
jgi:N-acetylglucosamine-6-phosphate deacetylase